MRDPLQTYIRRCLVADDALREEEHAQNDTHSKNDGHNYRQAIEVLLHDARGRAGVIQRASDHIRNAGALTGMHQNENRQRHGRNSPNDKQKNLERTHR